MTLQDVTPFVLLLSVCDPFLCDPFRAHFITMVYYAKIILLIDFKARE